MQSSGTADQSMRQVDTARILVVDDELGVRRSVTRALKSGGYAAEAVESGEAALAVVSRDMRSVRLVITDVVMPGMSGVVLATRLRALDDRLPIILITGYPGSHLAEQDIASLSLDLLEKPFTPRQLIARVAAALGPRGTA